jgi:hypothetical protein
VSDDSDCPIEWCRPVPEEPAAALAAEVPELELRTEPAHTEAFVALGRGAQMDLTQWQLVAESLVAWADEHGARPSDLGVRVTYLANGPVTEGSAPDCDFATPVVIGSR